MKRVTHYCSYGSSCYFPCYSRDISKHINSRKSEKVYVEAKTIGTVYIEGGYHTEDTHSVPCPLTSTNLKQVDCPECWKSILDMAAAKGHI